MTWTSRFFAAVLTGMLACAGFVLADAPALPGKQIPTEKKFSGRVVDLPKKIIKPGKGSIQLTVTVPKGYHLTDEAPCKFAWRSSKDSVVVFTKAPKDFNFTRAKYPLTLPVSARTGSTELIIDAELYLCEDVSKVCQLDNVRVTVPVEVAASGKATVAVTIEAEPPTSLDW